MPLLPVESSGGGSRGLHIEELICNVTVSFGARAMPLAETPPAAAATSTEPAQPRLEQALPRTITRPEADRIMAATVENYTRRLAGQGAAPGSVDARRLAERVYRLMREELELDRERE